MLCVLIYYYNCYNNVVEKSGLLKITSVSLALYKFTLNDKNVNDYFNVLKPLNVYNIKWVIYGAPNHCNLWQ